MLEGLIGLIILALDIVAIASVLKEGGTVARQVIWILVILIFPIIGMIIYFIFGRRPI